MLQPPHTFSLHLPTASVDIGYCSLETPGHHITAVEINKGCDGLKELLIMRREPVREASRLLNRQILDHFGKFPVLTEIRIAVIHCVEDHLIQSVSLQAPRVWFHSVHVPH